VEMSKQVKDILHTYGMGGAGRVNHIINIRIPWNTIIRT
jgi:hypothetical protein